MAFLRTVRLAKNRDVAIPGKKWGSLTDSSRRIVGMTVVINLLTVALVWLSAQSSLKQYHDQAAATAANINLLLTQNISAEIDKIDYALKVGADEYVRQRERTGPPTGMDMNAFLTRQLQQLPMVDGLRVADAEGAVICGTSLPANSRFSTADRDYFLTLRDDPNQNFAISRLAKGRINDKWSIFFARRLPPTADGRFSGVIFAAVSAERFIQKLHSLQLGPQGVAVMRGNVTRDFDLVARFPDTLELGQTKVSETFRRMVAAHPSGGTYEAHAGGDNVLRTFSYLAVGEYPLMTLVGLAESDYLGPWLSDCLKLCGLALVVAVVTVFSAVRLNASFKAEQARSQELARSNAELEQFAYIASHDLRQPVRTVINYLSLIEKRLGPAIDEDLKKYFGFASNGARRMDNLIVDLLECSRAGRKAEPFVSVQLAAAVAESLQNLAPAIVEAGALVTVADDLPTVFGNPSDLTRLFQNLIGNSIKYRHPRLHPEIGIGWRSEADHWLVWVKDNGVGIPSEFHERVFGIFQRLVPREASEGTGIGLTICRKVIEAHGGKIWIENAEQGGCIFMMTFPKR